MGMTRSPGLKRVTEGPVERTSPAQSELGGGGLACFVSSGGREVDYDFLVFVCAGNDDSRSIIEAFPMVTMSRVHRRQIVL